MVLRHLLALGDICDRARNANQAHDATPCEMCAFVQAEYALLVSIIKLKGLNDAGNGPRLVILGLGIRIVHTGFAPSAKSATAHNVVT